MTYTFAFDYGDVVQVSRHEVNFQGVVRGMANFEDPEDEDHFLIQSDGVANEDLWYWEPASNIKL